MVMNKQVLNKTGKIAKIEYHPDFGYVLNRKERLKMESIAHELAGFITTKPEDGKLIVECSRLSYIDGRYFMILKPKNLSDTIIGVGCLNSEKDKKGIEVKSIYARQNNVSFKYKNTLVDIFFKESYSRGYSKQSLYNGDTSL